MRVENHRSGNNENMAKVAQRLGGLQLSGAGGCFGSGKAFASNVTMKPHAFSVLIRDFRRITIIRMRNIG